MTITITNEMAELKAAHKVTWDSGDYTAVADAFVLEVGETAVEKATLGPGRKVLDVATRLGERGDSRRAHRGRVTGLDLAPSLLEVARVRAAEAGAEVEWVEGDAEALPYDEESFDTVLSVLGVQFAPRHEVGALELARVTRPGGEIVLCAWTPAGFIGQVFKTMGPYMPKPPEGASPPPLWGSEEHVSGLFADTGVELEFGSAPWTSSKHRRRRSSSSWPITTARCSRLARSSMSTAGGTFSARSSSSSASARTPMSGRSAWPRSTSSCTAGRPAPDPQPSTSSWSAVASPAPCAGPRSRFVLVRAGAGVAIVDRDELGTDTLSTARDLRRTAIARLDELGVLEPLCSNVTTCLSSATGSALSVTSRSALSRRSAASTCMIAPRRVALDRGLRRSGPRGRSPLARYGEKSGAALHRRRHRMAIPSAAWRLESGETDRGPTGRSAPTAALRPIAAKLRPGEDGRDLRRTCRCSWPTGAGLPKTENAEPGRRRAPRPLPVPGRGRRRAPRGERASRADARWARSEESAPTSMRFSRFETTLDPAVDLAGPSGSPRSGSAPGDRCSAGSSAGPAGPGWAIAGDAGHFKHPATAQGISDAIEHAIYHLRRPCVPSKGPSTATRSGATSVRRGHYEFSFSVRDPAHAARSSGPLFAGIAATRRGRRTCATSCPDREHPSRCLSARAKSLGAAA